MVTVISGEFLVTKVRYHRDIAPRSSCNNGWQSPSERFPSGQVTSSLFRPFFGVLLPRLQFKGKLSSAITSTRDHRVERRCRTRVKRMASRLDSRVLDRSKTN